MSHARAAWFGSKLGLLIDEGLSMGMHKWWKQDIDPESSDTPHTNHDPNRGLGANNLVGHVES